MDGTPRNGPPLPCTPLTAPQARLIAEAFRPAQAWGSRRDYYYTRGKLGSDPLYDGVLQHLPDDGQPVLDLGCGLGLFAHVLRQRGGTQRYLGVDVDAGKITRAKRAAADLHDVRFDCVDVQAPLPAQAGHVLLLDVLQYLDAGPQQALLRAASAQVARGGCLLLRTPLATGDGRDRTTRVADRLAWLIGWMGTRPRHYPDPQVLQTTLAEAGLQVTAPRPLHGRTPFNSWLLVAKRPAL
ncbi:class I SAM-dependent methyltransferase [Stenotrophomonas maltophilia]|uniref:class I SAM-dependent methyltransferase n=1 Tax=Stenotrophomonas maltophilia TaxID=40324 RepID=UPI00066ACF1C|nr:class I SAM-dependent methyltransferase [Stenotrophomonas maltophilia]ELK2669009.1 class I SAM-dependent methyltransferase [Stenotrophomonas maltophilia]KUJ05199.1 methyltransferase [Stenotrophomonas maltophilia]MBH1378158.1 class I SAM-dependent methyltransferase [Stenotrophomonas maltophilia]MBH1442223.1 class I SAM-dependent methyltransferase [Stenotrophomonas maltophilia]MBN4989185.1 class I SAM-dependent methyltransferase [Stenotrophomonas maltophilia]